MKQLILLLLLSLAVTTIVYGQGDSYYYKYKQQKLLHKDLNRVAVKFMSLKSINAVQQAIESNSGFNSSQTKEVGVGVFTLTLQQRTTQRSATNQLLTIQDVASVHPVYVTNDEGAELYLTDQICVQFSNGTSQQEIQRIIQTYNLTIRRTIQEEPYYLFSTPRGSDALQIANAIALEPNILFSHPDFYTDALKLNYMPNDRWFDRQFNLYNHGQRTRWGFGTPGADIKMVQAWDITRGSSSILVSVIDDGCDLLHEDISPSKRVPGYDFADGDPSVQPVGTNAHGTNTSGAIAADHNNIGIAGISPNSRIQMMKIFTDAGGGGSNDNLARAIDSARISGADVLSNSWGYSSTDTNLVPVIRQAIIRATTLGRGGKGCVVAFAAGNTASRPGNVGIITFPGSMSEVITVGASSRMDEVSFYSPNSSPSTNNFIELTAPSHRAYSSQVPTEDFEFFSTDISGSAGYNAGTTDTLAGDVAGNYDGSMGGTSAACPQVAGAAALILAVNPNLTTAQVTQLLISTADTVGGYNYHAIASRPGASLELGYGRMNVYRALVQSGANFGWVKGTITNLVGGTPLSGVLVDFTDPIPQASGTSSAAGLYYAAAQVDTPGTTRNVTLRARKFGYVDTTIALTITRNDTIVRNFAMRPAPGGTLDVYSHTPTANLRSYVEVKFGGVTVVSDSTNATTGHLSAPLPTGTYAVRVDAPEPYVTKTYPAVVITAGTTNNVNALTDAVFTFNPTSVRDTLPVGGSRVKNLLVTNNTADTVNFRITDDNALRIASARVIVPEPAIQVRSVERPKGSEDIEHSDSPNGHGGPDAFGYSWIDSDDPGGPAFNWFDISTIGTQITTVTSGTLDDGYTTIPTPWAISLYGNTYTSINIGTNGFVNFGTGSTSLSNGAIPSAAAPNNAIYAFWDDLDFRTSGKMLYYNDVANGRFVVQYDKAPRYGTTAVDTLSFQILMYPSGEMMIQFLRVVGTVLNSGTIGVENAAGTVALQVVNSAAYVHNNLAIRVYLPDASWLSETPTLGRINPGSNQNVQVTFDATGLTPGTQYNANLFVEPTHPDFVGRFTVPAGLKVQIADSAILALKKNSVTFAPLQINTTRRDTNWARNVGALPLNISSITSNNAKYVVTPASGTVASGDSLRIVVAYTPTTVGTDTGRVIILSNSQGTPRKDVTLSGSGIGAPGISVSVTTIADTLQVGQSHNKTFQMTNTTAPPTAPLYVAITDSGSWLNVTPAADTLAGSQTKTYTTAFNSTGLTPGTYTTNIRITSNDLVNPLKIVAATLRVTGGPVISTRPDSTSKTLALGAAGVDSFYIKNTGVSPLTWQLAEAPGSAPDMSRMQLKYHVAQASLPKGMDYPATDEPDTAGGPDAFGYRFIDSDSPGGPTFSWVDISGSGTQLDSLSAWVPTGTFNAYDEGYYPVALPFSFNYYGVSKDTLFIGTNGYVSFQRPTADAFTNAIFPTAGGALDNHIGVWWDDLQVSGGGCRVYYGTNGGNFVVQFQNISLYNGTVPNYTFEVILSPNGSIKAQYLAMGFNTGTLVSSSVGMENAGGTIGLNVAFNAAYMHNNLAILYSRGLSWLDETPISGTVNPGDSAKVRLDFNTTGLAAGVQRGILSIASNDFAHNPLNYVVRLTVTGGGTPSVTVTSPNGGELWNIGTAYNVSWNQNSVDSVTISYSTTGRTGTYTNIASVPARPEPLIHPKELARPGSGGVQDNPLGTFSWTIPNTASTNCFVRIVRKSTGTPGDTSDAAFTIRTVPIVGDTSWTSQTAAVTTTFYSVDAVDQNVGWAAGTGGIVVRTTDAGTTWTSVGGGAIGTADVYTMDAVDANTAFVSTSPSATFIYKTSNGGTTWTQVYTLAGAFIDGIQMTSSTVGYAVGDPVSANWLLLTTTDGGNTWNPMTPALPQVGTEAGWNNAFQVTGSNMWFGTNASKIYHSTNLGGAWTSAATTAANSYGVHFNNATLGAAGFDAGVDNISTNGGTSWAAGTVAGAAQNTGVAGVGNEFWLSGSTGNIYFTSNQGTTWTNAAKNGYTGTVALWAISQFSPGSGRIYGWAVGQTSKIVRYQRIPTGVETISDELPAVYALNQNYPNPFNPTTKIKYDLPEQSTVTLKIYNVLGQEVATLASGLQGAGRYEAVWDGRNSFGSAISSGVYFYRFEATGSSGLSFNSLKKMLFLK